MRATFYYVYQRSAKDQRHRTCFVTITMAEKASSCASSKPVATIVVVLVMVIAACFAEERDLYLVTMEGEPVAFLGGSPSQKDQKCFNPNR